jgi:hypothetical protein
MSASIFVKFETGDPVMRGDSTDLRYPNWIEASSYTILPPKNVSQPLGGKPNELTTSGFRFTIRAGCPCVPNLFERARNGRRGAGTMILVVLDTNRNEGQRVTVSDPYITSMSISGGLPLDAMAVIDVVGFLKQYQVKPQ